VDAYGSVTPNPPPPVATSVPSGYTITADNSAINAVEAQSTGFTFAGAGVGDTYNYTVTDSNGATVSGNGMVTSATQDVTGINVSKLSNGTLTFSVTLSNSVGQGPVEIALPKPTLDQVAPPGYTITPDNPTITSAAQADSTGFTFTGAEVGDTYSYTVTGGSGASAVTVSGTGTVTAANQNVTGINVSTLPTGTITFSVLLTNPAGSTAATTTAMLEVSPSPAPGTVPNPTVSTNWSGYAVQTNSGTVVNSVSGSWIVPAVSGTGTAYSSAWVGIDGYSSSSVEQIGTDSDLSGGHPSYYAWYEMYPGAMVETSLAVHAGNSISASVVYAGSNKFTLTLKDTTTGKSFTTTQTMKGAQRSSAEWIEEAPSSNSGVLPLADFNSITFSNCSANIGPASGSTSGTSEPIDNPWANTTLYSINMVTSRGATQDTTGSLTDSEAVSQFTVTYQTSSAVPAQPTVPSWVHRWWRSPEQSSHSASSPVGNGSSVASNSDWLARDRVFASRDPWLL
jgi:hypothetical protein